MTLFKRIVKAVSNEITKPPSFVKGEAFENYVRQEVFTKRFYKILHKTQNYESNRDDFIENSLMPDYEFQCIESKRKFHVEVKFRKGYYNKQEKIQWCTEAQLKRYKEINNDKKVFLALGLGDNPSSPEEIFIIPMSSIHFCGFFDSFLDKYSFYIDKPIFPKYLWSLK